MIAGKVIQGYREANRISVRALAKKIGVNYSALYRFEQGKRLKADAWTCIVKWLLTAD